MSVSPTTVKENIMISINRMWDICFPLFYVVTEPAPPSVDKLDANDTGTKHFALLPAVLMVVDFFQMLRMMLVPKLGWMAGTHAGL